MSDRWLPFYASAIAGWQNTSLDDRLPAAETVRGALLTTVHPFARRRPKQPPNRLITSWTTHDRGLAVLVAWGRIHLPSERSPATPAP